MRQPWRSRRFASPKRFAEILSSRISNPYARTFSRLQPRRHYAGGARKQRSRAADGDVHVPREVKCAVQRQTLYRDRCRRRHWARRRRGSLADHGAELVLADIDDSAGIAMEAELRSKGAAAKFVRTDIGRIEDLASLRDSAAALGVVHSLINIASKPLFATETTTFDIWREVFQWSVASYAVLATLVRPHMSRGSSIVNMSSISALRAQRGYGTYAASKAAVLSLTRSLAAEFGSAGIRVNAVCPGTVWTENNARHVAEDRGLDRRWRRHGSRTGRTDPAAPLRRSS